MLRSFNTCPLKLLGTFKLFLTALVLIACACAILDVTLFIPIAQAEEHQGIAKPVDIQEMGNGYVYYTLPAGSAFHVALQTPVNTTVNQENDVVEAVVSNTIYLGEEVIFSKNTRLLGRIIKLEPPIQGKNAVLCVRFDTIRLGNGEKLPVEAYVRTDYPDHSWGGEITPGTIAKAVVFRVFGIGDYARTVMAGPRQMGIHLEFLPGNHWIVILERPLTVAKASSGSGSQ